MIARALQTRLARIESIPDADDLPSYILIRVMDCGIPDPAAGDTEGPSLQPGEVSMGGLTIQRLADESQDAHCRRAVRLVRDVNPHYCHRDGVPVLTTIEPMEAHHAP